MAIDYEQGCKVRVKHGVLIRKSPEDVFNFVAEPDNFPKWQSALYEVQGKSNTTKNDYGNECLQQSAKVRDARNVFGKKIDAEYEVTDFEQGKSMTMKIVAGNIDWDMKLTFESFNGGTWFAAEGGGDLGADTPITQDAAERGGQAMLENDLDTLRNVLEAA